MLYIAIAIVIAALIVRKSIKETCKCCPYTTDPINNTTTGSASIIKKENVVDNFLEQNGTN